MRCLFGRTYRNSASQTRVRSDQKPYIDWKSIPRNSSKSCNRRTIRNIQLQKISRPQDYPRLQIPKHPFACHTTRPNPLPNAPRHTRSSLHPTYPHSNRHQTEKTTRIQSISTPCQRTLKPLRDTLPRIPPKNTPHHLTNDTHQTRTTHKPQRLFQDIHTNSRLS